MATLIEQIDAKREEWQRQRDRFAPSGGTDYLVAVGALRALTWVLDEVIGAPDPTPAPPARTPEQQALAEAVFNIDNYADSDD